MQIQTNPEKVNFYQAEKKRIIQTQINKKNINYKC